MTKFEHALLPETIGSVSIDFAVRECKCITCKATMSPGTRLFHKQPDGEKWLLCFCGDCIAPHVEAKRRLAARMTEEDKARRAARKATGR